MEGFGVSSKVADGDRPAADPSAGMLQPLSWLAQLVNNFFFFFLWANLALWGQITSLEFFQCPLQAPPALDFG